jgi:hypothetical protein
MANYNKYTPPLKIKAVNTTTNITPSPNAEKEQKNIGKIISIIKNQIKIKVKIKVKVKNDH